MPDRLDNILTNKRNSQNEDLPLSNHKETPKAQQDSSSSKLTLIDKNTIDHMSETQ